jgi:hypothetical protein
MWTDDITTLLEDANVATFGEDLFFSTKVAPAFLTSGAILVVVETPGRDPEYVHNQDKPRFVFPGAQVAAVAADYATARAKAQAAYDALVGNHNATINGTFYRGIKAIQDPFDGGLNARGQATCKFNIMGDKRP